MCVCVCAICYNKSFVLACLCFRHTEAINWQSAKPRRTRDGHKSCSVPQATSSNW